MFVCTLSFYYNVCFAHSPFIIMFVLHTLPLFYYIICIAHSPFIIVLALRTLSLLYSLRCAFSLYHSASVAHSPFIIVLALRTLSLLYCLCCAFSFYHIICTIFIILLVLRTFPLYFDFWLMLKTIPLLLYCVFYNICFFYSLFCTPLLYLIICIAH